MDCRTMLVWLWALFWVQYHVHGFLEEERIALLELKASINYTDVNYGSPLLLPSWKNGTDCCSWEGIKCSGTTGRVTEISVDLYKLYQELGDWYFNADLLLSFGQLHRLDLLDANLRGWVGGEGFQTWSRSNKLEYLDLSFNNLNESILPYLGAISSLKSLNLSYNDFEGFFPTEELANLTKLEVLHIGWNSLTGLDPPAKGSLRSLQVLSLRGNQLNESSIFKGFQTWSRSSKLQHLHLSHNHLNNSILPYLGAISSLKSLDLSWNNLEGFFPTEELANLRKLEVLDIGYNDLTGLDPPAKGSLRSLQALSLQDNQLNDSSIFKELANLTKLKVLNIGYNQLTGLDPPAEGFLRSLQVLSLRDNQLNDSSIWKGFQRWSRSTKLQHLDLSLNSLNNNSILPYLGAISSLKSLDLSGNNFEGFFPTEGFQRWSTSSKLEHLGLSSNDLNNNSILRYLGVISSLKSLDLSGNNFEGFFPTEELANLTKLKLLNIEGNHLIGLDPLAKGSLRSLQALYLARNRLNDSSIFKALCKLGNLHELDLSDNGCAGSLPPCLYNLSSLQVLDFSRNRFSGKISSLIASLTELRFLSLSHNRFEGLLSLSSFANYSKLEILDLSLYGDSINEIITYPNQLEVETESPPSWIPKFQLKNLYLSNCNINKFTGTFPSFLSKQYSLKALDLSHNNMAGRFPSWLLENNEGLEVLHLRSNSLVGPFHIPSRPKNVNAYWFDISNNNIDGQLPKNIGFLFPSLWYFSMSTNALQGSIPPSIGNMKQMEYLDLSRNNFSGEIPEQLATGCLSLISLRLSHNKLEGPVFPLHSNLTQLESVYLNGNRFTGKIFATLSRSTKLEVLDISENSMSGNLPSLVENFSNLKRLSMQSNYFKGPIPATYCNLNKLDFLDISKNRIFGSIPSCFNDLSALKFLHLQENDLTRLTPNALAKISSLVTLDMSNNDIYGNIPSWIAVLPNLRVLLLNGNHFQGHIPIQLCQMKNISILSLSNNSLSGPIPACFGSMMFRRTRPSDSYIIDDFDDNLRSFAARIGDRPTYGITVHTLPSFQFDFVEELEEGVEFVTKHRSEIYRKGILSLMSGIDLSWNRLTGEIPPEIGQLSELHGLNFSNNQLTGPIPATFSNLKQIESLDLSFNNLSGPIPSQLTDLYRLSIFTVAHNNLSGRTPDRKFQFGTFNETSYEGNPLLCGPPLMNCLSTSLAPPSKPTTGDKEENFDINFYACFAAAYSVFFLVFVTLLYINRYWRGVFFGFVDSCMYSCYYFAVDNLCKVFPNLHA